MHVYHVRTLFAHRGEKSVSDPLELELSMVVSHCVGGRN